MALDENINTFVVHVSFPNLKSKIIIDLAKKAWMALLVSEKVTVLTKYLDLAYVFLEKSAIVFQKQTRANEHVIKLKKAKQPPYRLIYSLGPIELNIIKIYIETNLAISFI